MSLRRTVSAIAPAVVVGTLVLLAATLVTIHSASAQSTETPDCSTGTAVPDASNNPGLVSDCEALLASRDTLAGTATLNWSVDIAIGDWDGITVEGTPERVTKLILADKGLTGEIPQEIGSLTGLRVLNLFLNRLTGEIPSELGKLSNLRELTISWNPLVGDIPEELGNLPNLRWLDLSWNRLTGPIPSGLGSLINLENLGLQANQLTGEMPVDLGKLTKLKSLDLSRNKLSGEIATEIGKLTKLKSLDLSQNMLSGEIPAELAKLSSLEVLHLLGNRFPGCIPEALRQFIANLRSSDVSQLPVCTGFDIVHTGRTVPQLYNDSLFVLSIEEELATEDSLPVWDYAARFYEYFEDEFDFLAIVSNLDNFAGQISPTRYAGRHYSIQNDVKGIGRLLFSNTERWGSAGHLQGVIHLPYMNALSRGPLLHELMHRWANFIVPTGIDVGGHWGFSSANGQLGGFDIAELVDHGDGRYSAGRIVPWGWRSHVRPYSPIELYLAGFLQPEEVPDLWVAEDGQYLRTEDGFCVRADDGDCMFTASVVRTYTIEDIIDEHGERVPSYSQSQRDFRVATILLVDEDHSLLKWQLDRLSSDINSFGFQGTDEYEDTYNFYEATGGRATITLNGLSSFLKDTVPASLPGVPTDLTAKTVDLPGIALSWMPPASDGFSSVIAYDLRYIETSADEMVNAAWTVVEDVWTTESGTLQYTLSGLTADSEYDIQVRAVNEVGDGPWSETAKATTGEPSICATGAAVPDPDNNPGLVSDCEALLASHDTLTGEATLNWSVDVPFADWDGITLDGTPQRVTRLSLTRRGLTGEIPPDLGDLDHLQSFQASSNELTGVIPPALGNLANLKWLILQNNQLSGEIPPELGNLTNLLTVALHNNELTGEVPSEVGNLASLRLLYLEGNQLTGMLPQTMTQMTALRTFYFSNNDGLCAPVDDVFQTWLQGIADVSGSSCASMESAEDRAVLVELYDALGGDNWRDNSNWKSDASISEWYGVSIDGDGRVSRLDLHSNQLVGEIPTEVADLSGLRLLHLRSNELVGEIPEELGSLANLERLVLSSNQLTGAIPSEIGNLTNLEWLMLGENGLNGAIPATLGSLINLEHLWLQGNQLTGSIPAELGSLTNLERLRLQANQLDGAMPAELGTLSNLQWLDLSDNRLTGPIPPELGNLSNLEQIYLSGNSLTGCVPDGMRDVSQNDLSSLNLPFCSDHECVTGGAVTDATNTGLISDCEALLASHGTLDSAATLNWSSDVPMADWDGITIRGTPERVAWLNIRETGLNGSLPAELGQLSKLTYLNLRNNGLTGPMPSELGDLTNLRYLGLNNNELTGPIPDLSGMTHLEQLYLSNNDLTGDLPDWMGTLTNVRELWLWGNELEGTIPDLRGMTGLVRIKLQTNNFTGGIPTWFGDMTDLVYLYLHQNMLTGEIPAELGDMESLRYLWLHTNDLTGEIPPELGMLSNLWDLNLHSNQLSGTIPAELGDMDILQRLRLHRNALSGEIPAALGELDTLLFMWLHGNQLTGNIPPELGDLDSLRYLYLSENLLSGAIPTELEDLTDTLTRWRLADNQFTGCVPAELAGIENSDFASLGLAVCTD